jgi:Protein of unknown function (DUF3991)/Toprim-like
MDFRTARGQVSIIQIAEHLGYTYNKSKGQNKPQYEHPNGDKVIISHPHDNSRQVYFNRDGSNDRGSVIDFIKNRLSNFRNISYQKEMDGVNQVLKQFANMPIIHNPIPRVEKSNFDINQFIVTPSAPSSEEGNIISLKYLTKRGLDNKTLTVFQKHIVLVQEKQNEQYKNIGFPYKNERGEVKGFELRNTQFRGHARGSDKESSVWMANLALRKEMTRNVFLFESAIDAMSFYQIYQNKYDFQQSAFISFGGALAPKQIDTVINSFKNARFLSGFDNDYNGNMYDIMFEKRLNPKFDIDFKRDENQIIAIQKEVEHRFEKEAISLKAVIEKVNLKPLLYVTKPAQGKDYNEMLMILNDRVKKNGVGY